MKGAHKKFSRGNTRIARNRDSSKPRVLLAALAFFCTLSGTRPLQAQDQKPTDYDVKAVYLYNFGRFVDWPANAIAKGDTFNVCILGRDPFGPALDATLAGETIGGKVVVAKRVSSPEELANCQIVFLSSTEGNKVGKIIEVLDKEAILTVSDMPQFSQRGGMIQFVLEGKRVRFEVNLSAVEHAGLVLSSDLLKVATTVRRSP